MRYLFILLLVLPFLADGQKNKTVLFDRYMEAQEKMADFSGTVIISEKGKIIYHKAVGLANREWNIANTLQSKYRIGSVTKQFTAAAILQLVEKGSLSLDDRLTKYFPDFSKGDSVTIHMLLNNTSGIKSYTNLPQFSSINTLPYTKDSVVALFKNLPYEFSPGSKYNYSNSGYFLLGYIIEKVSGTSYRAFLEENLFKKANLNYTSINKLDFILPNRASGYTKTDSGWKNAEFISMEFPFSAGAIISTAEDINQWQNALFAGKIISSAMLTKMTTPYLDHYGYGLVIDTIRGQQRIGHSGGIPGFQSYAVTYPATKVNIVVLSNAGNPYQISDGLAAIYAGIPVTPPYVHKAIDVDENILKRYTGRYQEEDGTNDTLVVENGRLYFHFPDGKEELKAESETTFFIGADPNYYFHFDLDSKKNVIKAFFINPIGIKQEIKRL